MKLVRIIFSLSLILLLTSTTEKSAGIIVKVKKHFEIELADYFSPIDDLNDEALLSYGYADSDEGEFKECYFIILHETHKAIDKLKLGMEYDADSYLKICAESIEDGLMEPTVEYMQEDEIVVNGLNYMSCEIEGEWDDMELYYQLGVYRGTKSFYQLLAWTPLNQKEYFKKDIDDMFKSFKEL